MDSDQSAWTTLPVWRERAKLRQNKAPLRPVTGWAECDISTAAEQLLNCHQSLVHVAEIKSIALRHSEFESFIKLGLCGLCMKCMMHSLLVDWQKGSITHLILLFLFLTFNINIKTRKLQPTWALGKHKGRDFSVVVRK